MIRAGERGAAAGDEPVDLQRVQHPVRAVRPAPPDSATLISTLIYSNSFVNFNFGLGAAMSVLLLVVLLVASRCSTCAWSCPRGTQRCVRPAASRSSASSAWLLMSIAVLVPLYVMRHHVRQAAGGRHAATFPGSRARVTARAVPRHLDDDPAGPVLHEQPDRRRSRRDRAVGDHRRVRRLRGGPAARSAASARLQPGRAVDADVPRHPVPAAAVPDLRADPDAAGHPADRHLHRA